MLYLAYYTVDFAESIDGSWIVVETGDGQVSGLAAAQDPAIYYHQCGDHYGTSFGMMGAVIPFMYRNRYADACGWWVKRDDPVVEGRKVSITNTLMNRREKGLLASLIGKTLDAVEYDSMFDCIPDRVDPWLDHMFRVGLGRTVDWSSVPREGCLLAMERSPVRDVELKALLSNALSDRLDDVTLLARSVDASYAYEGYAAYRAAEL